MDFVHGQITLGIRINANFPSNYYNIFNRLEAKKYIVLKDHRERTLLARETAF